VGDAFQQAVAARGEGGEFVIRLLDDVAKRSHRTWLVGGTVRDLLDHDLERPSNDLDFTGTVGPGELSEVAYRRRRRAGLTDHVWRVSPQLVCSLAPYDAPHERLLEYMPLNPKGRNACPPVWGGDLRADAATRDLTVNSLCYDHRQEIVIDPTGDGLAHLHARPRILATRNRTDDPVDQARLVLRFLKFCFRWEETDCTPIQDAVRVFPPDLAALIPEDRWNQIIRARDRCVPEGKRGEAELEIAERIGPAAVSLVRAVHKRTS